MSSREEILANIRKNTQKRFDYPEWQIKTTVYPDVVTEFCEMTRASGKGRRCQCCHPPDLS